MIFIIDIFVLEINHLPKQKINPKVKALIVESGLMHFTKWENAIQIQRAVLIPNKRKAMSSRFEKDLVWLYINNPEEFQSRRDIVLSKGNRKEYDAVVFFDGIREEQFKNMRFRKKDMAVVHKGIFKTEEIRIEKL